METQLKDNKTSQNLAVLKKGTFYTIMDGLNDIILEDKTKRGLNVQERSFDEKYGVDCDKGMIYDMDGIGHKVGIRWYFPKGRYTFEKVFEQASEMEQRYMKIREETCPDY